MSEEQNTTKPPEEQKNSKRWIPFVILGVVILGLLITVIILLVNNSSQSSELQEASVKIETVEDARTEAERLYEDARNQLEQLQVENEDLYIRLADKEAELEQQYAKISRLIRQAESGQAAQAKLEELREEIAELQEIASAQGVEIEELKAENARLEAEKTALEGEVTAVETEKKALAADKEELLDENKDLSTKVERAEVLRVSNIKGTGIRIRRNGEEKEVNRAGRSEQLRICFDINRNEVVETGSNRFFMQLKDPNNNIIQESGGGGGSFKSAKTDERVEYTKSHSFDYAPNVESLCIYWSQNQGFKSGVYQVELFNKNYPAGTGQFELK